MKSIKLINEEVTRMKSLFGYQRGKVVSEQNLIQELGIGSAIAQNQQKQAQVTPSIPTELKDINGVKAFQDWLDTNHKGWATGYGGGVLNKTGRGYGRMGPRTTKAWGQYKTEYLKSLQSPALDDKNNMTDVPPENGDNPVNNTTNNSNDENGDSSTNMTDVDNGNNNQTNSTTTVTAKTQPTQQAPEQPEPSPQPPTESGQPGEIRDGWQYDEKRQTWYKIQ
jgi:hypothetical protein